MAQLYLKQVASKLKRLLTLSPWGVNPGGNVPGHQVDTWQLSFFLNILMMDLLVKSVNSELIEGIIRQ